MSTYLNATPESGKEFYQHYHEKGKVIMLNLLRFRDKADYSGLEHLEPASEITGEEAYQLYINFTLPELEKAGGRVLYYGKSKHFLIGPETEQWDAILLVEHESVTKFMAFAQNEDYLQTAGHRTAALEDSRLLPSSKTDTPQMI